MRHLVDDVELLDGDLINLVEHINARDVDPAATETETHSHTQREQSPVHETLRPSVLQRRTGNAIIHPS